MNRKPGVKRHRQTSGADSENVLSQFGAGLSRSSFETEEATAGGPERQALRAPGRIGELWRGLDGVWRDTNDHPINITQKNSSGTFFNLLEPDPKIIKTKDLALGLSRENRWNGQTIGEYGYSVAQHSVAMVQLLQLKLKSENPTLLKYALLHDAEEGLGIKDTITGLKIVLGETYLEIANGISEAIHLRFSLRHPVPSEFKKPIKKADEILGMTEAIHLMNFTPDQYRKRVRNHQLQPIEEEQFIEEYIFPWPPKRAQERFESEVNRLWGE